MTREERNKLKQRLYDCYYSLYNDSDDSIDASYVAYQMEEMGINPIEFDDNQLGEICRGLDDGLTEEDVAIYANPKFNSCQMNYIYKGLCNESISREEVLTYADTRFSSAQMCFILDGYRNGIDASIYTDSKYDRDHMSAAYYGLCDGMTPQEVSVFLTDTKLTNDDMESILNAFTMGADVNEAKDVIENTKSLLKEIAEETVKINNVSCWNEEVTSDNPNHDWWFNNAYYNIETDKGNLTLRIALADNDGNPTSDNINRISLWADTESFDGNYSSFNTGTMKIYEGGFWTEERDDYKKICALLDTVNNDDAFPDEIHNITIVETEKNPGAEDYFFRYFIDQLPVCESYTFEGSIYSADTFAKFCEDHKNAVLNYAYGPEILYEINYEEFKDTVYDCEILNRLSDDYKREHSDAIEYLDDAHDGNPSGAKNTNEYMAKIDSIESCGVLDDIDKAIDNFCDAFDKNQTAEYVEMSVGDEITVFYDANGDINVSERKCDSNRYITDSTFGSEEDAINYVIGLISYDYAKKIGIPSENGTGNSGSQPAGSKNRIVPSEFEDIASKAEKSKDDSETKKEESPVD